MKENDNENEFNENFISTSTNNLNNNPNIINNNPIKNILDSDEENFSENLNEYQIIEQEQSCCSKFCYYLFCCCCCKSIPQSNIDFIKHWKEYLITENNYEKLDTPFIILTQLYTNQDKLQILNNLNKIRLNPNLISPIRNDLEFYIPQICTFLLYGGVKEIDEFFVFLCRVCNASFFFAHRVFWFLSAMIENSGEKKEMIENILNMINTIFLSETENEEKIVKKMYISNSNDYVEFINENKMNFLYENTLKGKNFNDVNVEELEGGKCELFKKYKNSRDMIIKYSEEEYVECCRKKNIRYNKNILNSNNNNNNNNNNNLK